MDGQMFLIFVKISRTSLFFLEYPPRIIGGFMPPISNNEMRLSIKTPQLHLTEKIVITEMKFLRNVSDLKT